MVSGAVRLFFFFFRCAHLSPRKAIADCIDSILRKLGIGLSSSLVFGQTAAHIYWPSGSATQVVRRARNLYDRGRISLPGPYSTAPSLHKTPSRAGRSPSIIPGRRREAEKFSLSKNLVFEFSTRSPVQVPRLVITCEH
ncbi:hypothetical protein EDB86DRAFT_1926775 [Lactarius hatsudake]|nr:hypothetical protein EDB86DRAFT_1926775 [Lactarius hatsudake]